MLTSDIFGLRLRGHGRSDYTTCLSSNDYTIAPCRVAQVHTTSLLLMDDHAPNANLEYPYIK